MKNRLRFLIAAASLIVLMGCNLDIAVSSERYRKEFHYSYSLKSGGKLTVENFNGPVEITGWDQETVDISGTKYGTTPALRDAVKIDIVPSADSIYIRTVRPSDSRGNVGASYVIKVPRRTQLERISSANGSIRAMHVEGNARLKTSNSSVRAFGIRGDLDAQTSNGSVEIEDLDGNANAKTSNGRIQAEALNGSLDARTTNASIDAQLLKSETAHPVTLETSNGSIVLRMHSEPRSDVHASTQNGGITLYLPASTSARVNAETTNSSVSSDFDLSTQTASRKQRLEGSIGSGGPLLELNTTNGNIKILKRM